MPINPNPKNRRLLGIDYGSKRVGVAVSDEEGRIAFPLVVLKSSKVLAEEIAKIASENRVSEIIIGESKKYDGKDNIISADIRKLKKQIEEKGLTVHMEPEFMTSVQAERWQGKNDLSDASAAAIILQSFLDKRKNSA